VTALRVLIVEDNRSAASIARDILLVEGGYDPVVVGDAEGAFGELLNRRPDLVLLDIGLPGPDGWFMLRMLLTTDPPIPVIVVSGQLDDESGDTVKAYSLGAVNAIHKPYSHQQLVDAIAQALGVSPPEVS
jgi:DNA-binding response OmpR family regulator